MMDRILDGIRFYIVENGGTPTKIYLGIREWTELKADLSAYNHILIKSNEIEVHGLKVFEVKKDSHFNITN